MKFSYNWIRELVGGLDQSPLALERLITVKTAECEGIEPVAELLDVARLARVESVEPLSGHNVKAVVDAGPLGRKTVVCGAPNCRVGVIAAYVPIGKKIVAGVESDGMLASAQELGINRDHSAIVELEGNPGEAIPRLAADFAIEIDNKSITHRPDLWGHHGMAREVAAITGLPLKDPVRGGLLPAGPPAVKVVVEEPDLCPRFCALVFDNVAVQPSPLWLQARLTAIGLNPINNIVDMSNLLMAELAQPTHCYDAGRVEDATIIVRRARAGERFRSLNDEEYTLDPSNLVIADPSGAIGLAGVIGGGGSAIGAGTTRVIFEAATFQAASVRKTSAAIKLRTDASMRFEKSQDPANPLRAVARAIELLQELSPGSRIVGGVADVRKEIPAPPPIELPLDWLDRKLGRSLPPAQVRQILERLEFGVSEPKPKVFSVIVPSWRATKDISIKDDLVEEVGRMVGYESIPPEAPLVAAKVPPANPERKFQHELRDTLVPIGFAEVYNYSFLSEESAAAFGFDPDAHVRVLNPIASDQALLRLSLLPGLWRNIVENAKHRESFRLFEIGLEIHKRAAGASAAGLPQEIPHLAAAVYERHGDGISGLDAAKHAVDCLMPGARFIATEAVAYEHPARAAHVEWRGRTVGRLFELHPRLVETGRAALFDIDLRVMRELAASQPVKYTPIRRYPSSAFDLSVIVPEREHAGKLEAAIRSFVGPLLESVRFVTVYSGPPFDAGQKSVSFRVTVGSAERTLANDEVTAVRDEIIGGMRGLGYELRV